MTRSIAVFAAIAFLLLGEIARAGDSCVKPLGRELRCAHCMSGCKCPDDYCPKPLPCICCSPQRTCADDYCRKPLPCIPCPARSCCPDDYCRKPLPNLCWATDQHYYRCPPPECRGSKPGKTANAAR